MEKGCVSWSERRDLEFITPKVSDKMYPSGAAGIPFYFSIAGNTLQIYPASTDDIELTYYGEFAPFNADMDTDWLLTKRPLLYLRTCQMMAAEWLH